MAICRLRIISHLGPTYKSWNRIIAGLALWQVRKYGPSLRGVCTPPQKWQDSGRYQSSVCDEFGVFAQSKSAVLRHQTSVEPDLIWS